MLIFYTKYTLQHMVIQLLDHKELTCKQDFNSFCGSHNKLNIYLTKATRETQGLVLTEDF